MRIAGAAFVLVGALWVGQGVGLIPGSFMTGSTFWAVMGGLSVAVGAGLLILGRRRGGGSRDGPSA